MLDKDNPVVTLPALTALVPLKKHSERVPGKNTRPFLGEPLFYRILYLLERSSLISSIVINTDCRAIARLGASFCKARIVTRPQALCGGDVPMNDIIAHDLRYCDTEHVLQTHATNPLLSAHTLESAIHAYFDNAGRFDSLFSVTPCQTRFYWENGRPVNHNPTELSRTQDMPCMFEENSCIYIFSKKSFLEAGNSRIGRKPYMFPMGKIEATDIDQEEDFLIAESFAKLQSPVNGNA